MYRIAQPICCIPKTDITLYFNYTSIIEKKRKEERTVEKKKRFSPSPQSLLYSHVFLCHLMLLILGKNGKLGFLLTAVLWVTFRSLEFTGTNAQTCLHGFHWHLPSLAFLSKSSTFKTPPVS